MYKIQTLNAIATIGLNQFPREHYEVSADMQNPDAILVRSQAMHDMTFSDTVKVVGRAGAGVNNIPITKLTKMGIPVLNTVGANANAVRELVLAGMLLACRNICQAWDYVRHLESTNKEMDKEIEQNKKQFVGFELLGKTLGVIGLGSIGVKVANAAMNLGMKVIGYDPTISVNRAWELSAGVNQARSIESLLAEADFVTFHIPLTEQTKNLLNTARIQIMKTGVILLNFSRDGIIDNDALIDAINQNKIATYVTDFPHPKLLNHPHVISLPHLGASTKEAEDNCAVMIVKQVKDYLENGSIVNAVNFPTIEMPLKHNSARLAIVNENVPNIVAQISSVLGNAGINIASLLNGSKDQIAYTLIDVNADIKSDIVKNISAIHGVIRVRLLSPVP